MEKNQETSHDFTYYHGGLEMKQALQAYIDALLETPEYKEYAVQKERVKQYPELKARIDEFRTRNFEMQTSRIWFLK